MSKLDTLKHELTEVLDEIDSLYEEKDRLEDEIDKLNECEELEHVVLAALNKNYNQWCNRAYFQKNICWLETELDPKDEESVEKVLVCCDILYDKGTIQRKFTGKTDDTHEPIYVYRITDTETPDMFGGNEVQK